MTTINDIDMSTAAKVVKVDAIMFEVTIHGATLHSVENTKQDIRRRYACIDDVVSLRTYELIGGVTSVVRIVMDEDADYQQICALRAELKP